jgi:hypothetical protein
MKSSFNKWLLSKILGFLSTSQGFLTEESAYTSRGVQATVRDVFGHRYQINVKLIGRTVDHIQPNKDVLNAQEHHSIAYAETKKTFV